MTTIENKIICGDNLEIMREIPSESIDLVYLDPPFFTQTNWEKNENMFEDRWKNIDEYLEFMSIRLKEMYRILKFTGTIYLHCDWHANSELNIEMKKIFGVNNFLNEIIWRRYEVPRGLASNRLFFNVHDSILVYSKTNKYIKNIQYIKQDKNEINNYNKIDEDGNKYYHYRLFGGKIPSDYQKTTNKYDLINDTYYLRRYYDKNKGKKISNVWTDIGTYGHTDNYYPTQKPPRLLERIIKASSNPGDIVLDPFCGSGTTCTVAKKLGRKYIGIDKSPEAVKMTEERLNETKDTRTRSLFDF